MYVMASISPSHTAAASLKDMLVGFVVIEPVSGRQMYSACVPKLGALHPKTWPPGDNVFTHIPIASISPASSLPNIVFLGLKSPLTNLIMTGYSGFRNPQSVRFTVVACILISTSLSLGVGLGTSLS
jgi:hypothetical protein